ALRQQDIVRARRGKSRCAVELDPEAAEAQRRVQEVVPLLAAATAAHRPWRGNALEALGALGPAARKAVPALVTCLKDPNSAVLIRRGGAVAEIAPAVYKDPGEPVALAVARPQNGGVGRLLAAAISRQCGKQAPVLPVLRELIRHPNPNVRAAALDGIRALGP